MIGRVKRNDFLQKIFITNEKVFQMKNEDIFEWHLNTTTLSCETIDQPAF